MIPDEFRRHGYQVIDWIADYYERIESSPVLSQVAPGEVRAGLPAHHRRTAPASTAYWPISTR
jgi:aromatic-L-amino-acid decarboxylase